MTTKSALDLLIDYGGDSSDEEVPGCKVSTKRVHRDADEPPSKRLQKLPTPNLILYKLENGEANDDPSFHEGRIRSFPHERGNWATYVYIPFELNDSLQKLLKILINMCCDVDLKAVDDFHISLTKTVVLKHHWIDPFVQTIKENLSSITKFMILFNCINVYCNEEKTRTFLGLQIKTGFDSLIKLVECLDNSLQEFKLPTFYEDKSFHMSIVWCIGDHTEKLNKMVPLFNEALQEVMNESTQENWYIYVQYLMCKIGNKLYQFHML